MKSKDTHQTSSITPERLGRDVAGHTLTSAGERVVKDVPGETSLSFGVHVAIESTARFARQHGPRLAEALGQTVESALHAQRRRRQYRVKVLNLYFYRDWFKAKMAGVIVREAIKDVATGEAGAALGQFSRALADRTLSADPRRIPNGDIREVHNADPSRIEPSLPNGVEAVLTALTNPQLAAQMEKVSQQHGPTIQRNKRAVRNTRNGR